MCIFMIDAISQFLRPSYPGMLKQIARNVFNIVSYCCNPHSVNRSDACCMLQVFMLDPLSTAGVEMMEYLKLFLDHLVPARLGLLLVPDPKNAPAVSVCQGFAFLTVKSSPREGLRWLLKV